MSVFVRPLILAAVCAATCMGCNVIRETATDVEQRVRGLAGDALAQPADAVGEPTEASEQPKDDQPTKASAPGPIAAASPSEPTTPIPSARNTGAPVAPAGRRPDRDPTAATAVREATAPDSPPAPSPAAAPPSASADAACLHGTFSASDLDEVFERAVRRQAQYRRPSRISNPAGRLRLSIDTASKTVSVSLANARGHYRVQLAGIPVDYRLYGSTSGEGSLVAQDDRLSFSWDEPVRIRESVVFGERGPQGRSVSLGLEGDYRFECADDTLKLYMTEGDYQTKALTFRRVRKTS